MNNRFFNIIFLFSLSAFGCSSQPHRSDAPNAALDAEKTKAVNKNDLIRNGEYHFAALKQLTFSGENAEAYFNAQGSEIIFQSTRDGFQCDQIFTMGSDGTHPRLVSTGLGRTTCGFLFPNSPKLIYSSSHKTLKTCPQKPDYSKGYVWPLLADLDIYISDETGKNPVALSPSPGYDAEGVISPTGDAILFTSTRGGDIDIWIMDADGKNATQLTHEVGYDGGAFFSYDGKQIVYRANHPKDKKAIHDYSALLAEGLVRPSVMDLFVMNRDGSNKRNILSNGAANFAPYFHPDGKRIIFASNMDDPGGRNFDLYLINVDGSGLERVTFEESFDAFPMFSHDGTQLIFSSNRGAKKEGDTNVFIAKWTDQKPKKISLSEGSQKNWSRITKKLSSKSMEGRAVGGTGIKKAETFLNHEFSKLGYHTESNLFPINQSTGIEEVHFLIKQGSTKWTPKAKDVRPASFSGDGSVQGEVIFIGSEEDPYKNKNPKNKIVVLISQSVGDKYAAINAKHHGANAVILINDPKAKDNLAPFEATQGNVKIPVFRMTFSFASKLFPSLKGNDKERIQISTKSLFITLHTKIKKETTMATNIIARLKGKNKNGRRIVVGAHFDHLGFGGDGSLSPDVKAIHPGADDNASGVASILEIARALKPFEGVFERDIYFVLFSGEESGLLGSQHFVSDPSMHIDKVDFMINFDMIGRMKNNKLDVFGTGSAKGLVDIIQRAQVGLLLDLKKSKDGFGPSDQSSFFSKRIPVLHFFTGLHNDYHRPSDSAEKLNPNGAEKIGTLAIRIIRELADKKDIVYTKIKSHPRYSSGGSREYGVYFGSVPSFGKQPDEGVRLSGTRAGSPAEKAGVKANDIIVKFGKFEVDSMEEYAFALRQYKPGDRVEVIVDRGGIRIKLKATLQKKTKKRSPHKTTDSQHD